MLKIAAWLFLLSNVSLIARAQPAGESTSVVEQFKLPNGLRVVLEPDTHGSRALLLVRYAAGSRDDPRGYRGLAHLTEHLAFRHGEFQSELDRIGATEWNGITTPRRNDLLRVLAGECARNRPVDRELAHGVRAGAAVRSRARARAESGAS